VYILSARALASCRWRPLSSNVRPHKNTDAAPRSFKIPKSVHALISAHWRLANERKWEEFAALLHPDLRYEVPQTREYISSAEGYVDMFHTWPGDWKAEVQDLVCEEAKAISIIEFKVGKEVMTGITVFSVAQDKIAAVTDYWPEPYEPPQRVSSFLKRRASEA
jgi:SnoaL-like domain